MRHYNYDYNYDYEYHSKEESQRIKQSLPRSNSYEPYDNAEDKADKTNCSGEWTSVKLLNPQKQYTTENYCSFSNYSTLISQRDLSNICNKKPITGDTVIPQAWQSTDLSSREDNSFQNNLLTHCQNPPKPEIASLSLSKEQSSSIKKILSEKDSQILMLINKNNELTQCNEKLLLKLDNYLNTMNDTKSSFSARLSTSQSDSDHLRNELQRMEAFYKKKIAFHIGEAEPQRNKLIYSYDNTIEQIKLEFSKEKDLLAKIIEAKDEDLRKANEAMRKEQEKSIDLNSEYKKQLAQLAEERENLLRSNKEMKEKEDIIINDLNKAKRETKAVLAEKMKNEEQTAVLLKENGNLRSHNDKLNRLTHGKIK